MNVFFFLYLLLQFFLKVSRVFGNFFQKKNGHRGGLSRTRGRGDAGTRGLPLPVSPCLRVPMSPLLVGRTVTVIVVGIVEAVFGAKEQAAYGKEDC
jgi:hypothetical protein